MAADLRGRARPDRVGAGEIARELHHAGSTSVPGLQANPIIDIVLVVPDAADEGVHAAARSDRLFVSPATRSGSTSLSPTRSSDRNLHVFPTGWFEVAACSPSATAFARTTRIASRESTKAALSEREWPTVQDYADAKDEVVADIMSRMSRVEFL